MDKNLAIGTATFTLLSAVLGLAVSALTDLAGAPPIAGQACIYLLATPLAILGARRAGYVTHLSLFIASLFVAITTYWAIVLILDTIAQPVGGHVDWSSLFTAMTWHTTVATIAAMLLAPQIWLWLLNRLVANNSFKPKLLRSGNGVAG